MRKIIYVLIFFGFLFSCKESSKGKISGQNFSNTAELDWLENWFSAWELVSEKILRFSSAKPPEMLFYDEKYVYTTSEISVSNGEKINGPKFLGKELPWKKAAHNDTLILPDGQSVPVQLMSFAGPLKEKPDEAFFVMAAPEFWKKAGVESKEIGLEKLMTGVFLHEFSHTQQVNGFGLKISGFEKNHQFKFEVSDDLIQDYFSKDSSYVRLYNKEVDLFYTAATSENIQEVKQLAKKGLELLRQRQSNYLLSEKDVLVEMDNIFLTMEGLGQYMIVAWLIHPEGGNLSMDVAVNTARRGKKWWSQDEGLALFLVLSKISQPDWANDMFSTNPKTVIELLENELK